MLDILHCTPEVAPFSKTGGLADVSSALPQALTRLGHKVDVVTPLYAAVDRARWGVRPTGRTFDVTLGGRTAGFEVFEAALPAGTRVLLLANDDLFGRERLYGTRDGDYPDNHVRFAFFAAAALRVVRAMRLRPDVLHCHDWQAGLVPVYNRVCHLDLFATVLTVHNLAYQGLFPDTAMVDAGLPWDLFNPEQVEFWGKVGYLKAGLVFADRITTVSPGYAREIRTPAMGCGLDGVLARREADVVGILNGADYDTWSPACDPYLPPDARFDADDLAGKRACRELLLRELRLPPTDGPILGAVGRFAEQKGFDLVAAALPDIVATGASVVLLGAGDREVEDLLSRSAELAPGRVALRIAYDDRLAHLIEAGSDFFLMPSRYEPCGLNQMYSMAYGTLPIVHAVGGLDDTVVDLDEDPARGTGLKLREPTAASLAARVRRAASLWSDRPAHRAAVRRAMAQRFSWEATARVYADLYASIAR
jgi:starch synthase